MQVYFLWAASIMSIVTFAVHTFIGGGYRTVQDVPPFILAQGEPLQYTGINRVGLRRRGFSAEDRQMIKSIYRLYFRSPLTRSEALKQIKTEYNNHPLAKTISDFIAGTTRGII